MKNKSILKNYLSCGGSSWVYEDFIELGVRGYHFAPTHALQDNTPVENVIAMYNVAHKYGRY